MILLNNKQIDGVSIDSLPIGTISPYLGNEAPKGYLLCQGQLVSKRTYYKLYEICKSIFGEETENEFYLPDLRGKTITGYKQNDEVFGTLGGLIGELTHAHEYGITYQANAGVILGDNSLGADIIGVYNNGVKKSAIISDKTSTKTLPFASDSRSSTTYTYSAKANTTESSNLQPSINMNWIVKAIEITPNQSVVVNAKEASSIDSYSCDYINNLKELILDMSHPIGSYYWSSDSTNPHLLFGGVWEQIKDKFVIAVGDSHTVGTNYGSNTKDISHTHSIGHTHGVPGVAHTHSYGFLSRGWYGTLYEGFSLWNGSSWVGSSGTSNSNATTTRGGNDTSTSSPAQNLTVQTNTGSTTPSSTTTNSQSTSTSGSGGSTTLDITPACEAAYCWKRIS